MESLKIVFYSIAAGVLYGIIHDQITVRICAGYFTLFHPRLLPEDFPPTLVALAWGVVATWWAGAILGLLLALAARAGSRAELAAASLLPSIGKLLLVMAGSATLFGIIGFVLASNGVIFPPLWVQSQLPPSRFPNFMADWWAHTASYASAFLGGMVLCVIAYRRRRETPQEIPSAQ
jgi:hypothetical protein